MQYSLCYLDNSGHKTRSELMPFDDDRAALAFANIGLVRSDIVEVWRGDDLVRRLYREGSVDGAPASGPLASPAAHARGVTEWDNEGGAVAKRQQFAKVAPLVSKLH